MQMMTSARRAALCILPGSLLLAGASCEGEAEGVKTACARPPIHTLVFVDQSASSVVDAATDTQFRATVDGIVGNALVCKGDAVHGFVIHGNTRGKVGRKDLANQVDRPDMAHMSKLAQSKARAKTSRDSTKLADSARLQLAMLFSTPVEARFKRHTDVLGTLEVISDQLAGIGSTDSVRIVYLGDMRESMAGQGRRDFDSRLPGTSTEAEAWADADTAVLKSMVIHRERFRNAEVRVLLGSLANKPGAPEVRRYWERLFKNAGFDPARIHFN